MPEKLPEKEILPQVWYVYILECADGTLYTGMTNHLVRRLAAHNAGKGAKYTKTRRPVHLRYSEKLQNQSQALRREAEIRSCPMRKNARCVRILRERGMQCRRMQQSRAEGEKEDRTWKKPT